MFRRILSIIAYMIFVPAVSLWAIGVDPTRVIINTEPGKTFEGSFSVFNDKDFEMQVSIEVSKGIDSGENAEIIKDSSWLSVKENSFVIEPKNKKNVDFKAWVPDGTAGTFSARISFVDRSDDAFTSAVTIPVYVIIKGTEIVDWDVESVEIADTPAGPAASIKVNNTGNVHFYTNGRIVIRDSKGGECWNTQFGGGRAVFPKQVTQIPFDVSKMKLKNGKYRAEIELSGYGGETRTFRYLLVRKGSNYTAKKQ